MSVWECYDKSERQEYKDYLKMYGQLSALFNQKSSSTGAPYLDSKFQETVYAKSFNSEDVDIGNTPHDIKSKFGQNIVGIGVKTWLNSNQSFQKVMQLKAYKNEIDRLTSQSSKDELAFKIARIKNDRMLRDYKRLGLLKDKNIYHYVTRDKGRLVISETSYPLIDIDKIQPGELSKSSFTFKDGEKNYKYTFGDSQVWMLFGPEEKNTEKLDQINLQLLEDPFKFLYDAFNNYNKENGVYTSKDLSRDYLYLPLYSYKTKKVSESSGLNAWNGKPKTHGSMKPRPNGEAYIPIPLELWKKYPNWVNPEIDMSKYKQFKNRTHTSSYPIKLHMPDGQVFDAIFGQENFKGLQTNPQSVLGKWILDVIGIKNPQRRFADQPATEIVTMEKLMKIGYDSVKLWHQDESKPNDIWIDFAEYGSFERFMNDEVVDE